MGSTTRCLYERRCEHMGISFLTGRKVSKPRNSSIHDHSTKYSHNMNPNSFKIIGQANKYDNILLLESVHIKYNHPDLNDMYSSYPLHLTWLSFLQYLCIASSCLCFGKATDHHNYRTLAPSLNLAQVFLVEFLTHIYTIYILFIVALFFTYHTSSFLSSFGMLLLKHPPSCHSS